MRAFLTLAAGALLALALCARGDACAQQQQQSQRPKAEAPASVAGRVRLGERGVGGVTVALMPEDAEGRGRPYPRAKTDAEGFYRVDGLAPGRYRVVPSAPAYVVAELRRDWRQQGLVTLAAGESVEDMNFTLARGGVITGRVRDADGRPLVAEPVNVTPVDENQGGFQNGAPQANQTDDRGVYRIYGLPAGRYHVSVGIETNGRFVPMGGPRARNFYARTYHPDVNDSARATVVEVKEGGEAEDVDITVGRSVKTFRVSGRVVDAATGRPAPNVTYSYGIMAPNGRTFGGYSMRADEQGEFTLEGMLPGRYGLRAEPEESANLFGELTPIEVVDSDLTGVELKLRPGATLAGTVAVEGAPGPARAAALMKGLTLRVYSMEAPGGHNEGVRVGADGAFLAAGLRPGKTFLNLGYPLVKGLTLERVELNGVELRDGIEVAEGARLAGVRVVFRYGTGRVRGQIVLTENGQPATIPEGTSLNVFSRPAGAEQSRYLFGAMPDARGRFVIENLPPGAFEVMAQAVGRRAGQANETVSVPDGGETSVTLNVELRTPAPRPPRPRPQPRP